MNRTSLPTEDELLLVQEYILLPIVLDVLERDIKLLSGVPLKMLVIYIQSFRNVQNIAIRDLHRLQTELRKRGIKVYDQRRTKINIETEYLCRGYRHTFTMLWGLVKAEVEKRLGIYMDVDLTATE